MLAEYAECMLPKDETILVCVADWCYWVERLVSYSAAKAVELGSESVYA